MGEDLTVKLEAVGNPDFYQPMGRLRGVPCKIVKVPDYATASKMVLDFIEAHDLGGGNWSGGDINCRGCIVARVSYNGRVWAKDGPNDWGQGKLLYDPRA